MPTQSNYTEALIGQRQRLLTHLFSQCRLLQQLYHRFSTLPPVHTHTMFREHSIDEIAALPLIHNILEATPLSTDHRCTASCSLSQREAKILSMIEACVHHHISRCIQTRQLLAKERAEKMNVPGKPQFSRQSMYPGTISCI